MKCSFVSLLVVVLFVPHVMFLLHHLYQASHSHSFSAQPRDTGRSALDTMRTRSLRISKYCSKYPHLRTGWRNNSDVLVSRLHKLSWCKIPKSASTSTVQALLLVLGREALVREAHRSRQHTTLRRLMPPLTAAEEMPSPGNAFMLIRHPFSRILSAYRDKIATKSKSQNEAQFAKFLKLYNLPIIAKYRQRQPENSFYQDVPTFSEFVLYMLDTPSGLYNEHWRPYSHLCTPCDVPYNLVLKVESLKNDNLALILATGLPKLVINATHRSAPETIMHGAPSTKHDFNKLLFVDQDQSNGNVGISDRLDERTLGGWDAVKLEQYYFSQLTQAQILELFDIYRVDFEMFGYDIEPFLSYGMS